MPRSPNSSALLTRASLTVLYPVRTTTLLVPRYTVNTDPYFFESWKKIGDSVRTFYKFNVIQDGVADGCLSTVLSGTFCVFVFLHPLSSYAPQQNKQITTQQIGEHFPDTTLHLPGFQLCVRENTGRRNPLLHKQRLVCTDVTILRKETIFIDFKSFYPP